MIGRQMKPSVVVAVVLGCGLLLAAAAPQAHAALIARWDLDDGSGTTVSAEVGSITGTMNNNAAWQIVEPPRTYVQQMPGTSDHLLFGGTASDYVDFGNSSTLNPGHARVGFWAKATGLHNKQILLSKWNTASTTDSSWEFGFDNPGRLWYRTRTASGTVFAGQTAADPFTTTDFNDGHWHYIMGLHDGSQSSLFVDGKLIQSVSLTGNLSDSGGTTSLLMGQRPHGSAKEPYDGLTGGPMIIANDGVVAGRWNIDDGSGGTVTAQVGSIDGTINGTVAWQGSGTPKEARPAHGIKFGGGTTDDVNLGNSSTLNPESLTVAFWAKASGDHSRDVLLSKWNTASTSDSSYEFGFNSAGSFWFRTRTASGQVFAGKDVADPFTATEFNDGEWHHIVGTHDGTTSSLYVDGVLIEGLTNVGGISDSGGVTDLLLGRRPHSGSAQAAYDGWLGGSVLIFDRALSATEVYYLSNVPEPSTVTLLALGLLGLIACRWRRK